MPPFLPLYLPGEDLRCARLSPIYTLGLGYKLCEVIAHCAPLPLSRFRTTSPMNTTSAPSNHEPEGITHDLTSPSEHEPRKIVNQDITYIASPKMSQESDNKPSATAGRDPPRQLWFKPPPLQQIGELYFEQGVDPRSTLRANLLSRARHDNESHPISC